MTTVAQATNLEPQVSGMGCLVPLARVLYVSVSFTSGLGNPAKVVHRPLAPLPSFGDILLGMRPLTREENEGTLRALSRPLWKSQVQRVTIDFPWLGSLPPNLHCPSHFSSVPFA